MPFSEKFAKTFLKKGYLISFYLFFHADKSIKTLRTKCGQINLL